MDVELLDANRVQPRRNRHRLLPVRPRPSIAERGLFLEKSVGDHLVPRRGGDDELARGFVRRMIDRRQPLARPVRPILAEGAPFAVLVLKEAQAVGRRAAVRDREDPVAARCGRRRQRQRQHVILMHVLDARCSGCHRRDGHALAVRGRREVERDPADAVFREEEIDRRLSDDVRARVGQLDPEHVVPGIDARLPWVGVGDGRCGPCGQSKRGNQRPRHQVPLYQHLHVSSNELGRPITLLSRPEGLPHSVPPPRRRRTGSV